MRWTQVHCSPSMGVSDLKRVITAKLHLDCADGELFLASIDCDIDNDSRTISDYSIPDGWVMAAVGVGLRHD